jgi:hypothetical protein
MSATLILVTGTKIFLTRRGKNLPHTVPALSFCTAGRITGRVPGWSFRNLIHAQVVGITTVRLSMGFHGGAPWPILPFAVKRRLSHILKYSERPTAASWNKSTPHYQVTDLLYNRLLDRPVRYQAYMVAGGWGERKLIPEEIRDAFDIPSWLLEFPQGPPPIKLLVSCLDAVQHRVPPQDNLAAAMLPTTRATLSASTYIPLLKHWIPHIWADATLITDKASKADDAEAAFIWDQWILLVIPPCISLLQKTSRAGFSSPPISPLQALNRIRDLVQQKQWKLIFLDFRFFLIERHGPNWDSNLCAARADQRIRSDSSLPSSLKRSKGGKEAMTSSLILNTAQGCAVLRCFTNGSWWDWKLGSTLFFWRWGEALPLSHVRDGIPIFVMGELPRASSNQRGPAKYKAPLLASKLDTFLERQYIRKGPVKSFIDYFDVPKGPDDIRVVYHGSKYGLNAQLWTPRFYMPNGSGATNGMSFETYLTDPDVGEIFPNFPIHPKLRPHAGVDLRSLSHCLKKKLLYLMKRVSAGSDYLWAWPHLRTLPFECIMWQRSVAEARPQKKTIPWGMTKYV